MNPLLFKNTQTSLLNLFLAITSMVRHKNRYFLIRATPAPPTSKSLQDLLLLAISKTAGLYGRALLRRSFSIKHYTPSTGTAVVRAARDFSTLAAQSLRKAPGVTILGQSGTLYGTTRILARRNRGEELSSRSCEKSPEAETDK